MNGSQIDFGTALLQLNTDALVACFLIVAVISASAGFAIFVGRQIYRFWC